MEVIIPEDVMFNIFLRLPVKTIIRCKCVCKKWRNMVLDSYFVNLHLSRPRTPGLMVHYLSINDAYNENKRGTIKLVEIKEDLDLELDVTKFSELKNIAMVGSVNGLICLLEFNSKHNYCLFESSREYKGDKIYVCNPITKEYIILPKPLYAVRGTYGFGVSMSGEYKVIRIFQRKFTGENLTEIEVYTLGTGQWRTIGPAPNYISFKGILNNVPPESGSHGFYLNAFVYWFDSDIVYAYDLDDEIFQLLPSPPAKETNISPLFGVLKGCLSLYYRFSGVFCVWVMKENRTEISWELAIENNMFPLPEWEYGVPMCFINDLNDKSMLIDMFGCALVAYSLNEDVAETERTDVLDYVFSLNSIMLYYPSCVKLCNFQLERLHAL